MMEQGTILEKLRENIIWLDHKPESVLNLSQLATEFNVSRTPVKEALVALQAEGWIISHGTHFMVTPLSLSRFKEMTEIRTLLEVQANQWALCRMTPRELDNLNGLVNDILETCKDSSNREILKADYRFHLFLYRATKNNQLAEILEKLLAQSLRFLLSIPRECEPDLQLDDISKILKNIHEKNEEGLRQATIDHIKRSVDTIMDTF